ncbi:murein biosynthesis integral membrane protein MurJ [Ruminococcus sp. f11]
MVASTYGAGFVSDIYAFEDSFINEIYTIFSTFLACSFIPKYLSLNENGKNKLFSLLLNWGTIIMVALMCMAFIFTEPLLKILVPGFFNIYDITKIIFVTRINLIMLLLTFWVNYTMTILQAHEIFVYLSLESVILNIIVIIYLLFLSNYGILGLLLCRVFAYLLLLFLIVIRLRHLKTLKYTTTINPFDSDLIEMIKLSLPMLLITILWQVNYIIDKSMASRLSSGSIACLNYANTISMIIYNVVGYIISTYAYPLISKVQDEVDQVKLIFKEYFFILLQLVLPIAILTMFYSDYVSDFLYGRGNMLQESIKIISKVLVLYIPGSVAFCIKNLYSKLFYIKKNTKIVLCLDVLGCIVNIILNLIFIRIFGVYGLALATSFSYVVTVLFQMIFSNRKCYTDIRFKDCGRLAFSVVIIIVVATVSKWIMINYIYRPLPQFVFVGSIYIISCALCSYKDLKKCVSKTK